MSATTNNVQTVLDNAGLNWEVKTGPVFDADMREIAGFRRTYRADTQATLGIVGMRYHVAQNLSLGEAANEFATVGQAQGLQFGIEKGHALYGGRKVAISALFDRDIYIGGEAIEPRLILSTTHDGTGATRGFLTATRFFCTNQVATLSKRAERKFSIRHTQSADRRLAQIDKELGLMRRYFIDFEANANKLLSQAFSRYQFEQLAKDLFPINEDDGKRAKTVAEASRELLLDRRNAQDLDAIRNTAWGAYNAVADYADHHMALRGEDKASRAFERTFEDSPLKDRALELILA